jgi:hypothetical protein
MARFRILIAVLAVLGGSACQSHGTQQGPTGPPGSSSPTTSETVPTPTSAPTRTPLPRATTHASAVLGQPVVLDVGDGVQLAVTLQSTALRPEFVGTARPFSMFLRLENVGERDYRGSPGKGAMLTDDMDARVRWVPHPAKDELLVDAPAFGYSNDDFARRVELAAGRTKQGVIVFLVPGGPREVHLHLSVGGATADLTTNFGLL